MEVCSVLWSFIGRLAEKWGAERRGGLGCGLTRPAGLALRATFGSLPSATSAAFRLSRSARLWRVESGEWRFWLKRQRVALQEGC